MKYLAFCHANNKTRYWISTCTYLLILCNWCPAPQYRSFKDNNKCVANSYLCNTHTYRKTHLKSRYEAFQCFQVLIPSVFMTESSCLISISGNHLNHWGTIGKKTSGFLKDLPWDICVFSDLASVVKAEPTAVLWDMLALPEESVPKDVKEPPALKEII